MDNFPNANVCLEVSNSTKCDAALVVANNTIDLPSLKNPNSSDSTKRYATRSSTKSATKGVANVMEQLRKMAIDGGAAFIHHPYREQKGQINQSNKEGKYTHCSQLLTNTHLFPES